KVRDVQRRVRHSAIAWIVATLDGIAEGTGAVFESKFMLARKVHAAAPTQYVGHPLEDLGALDHHQTRSSISIPPNRRVQLAMVRIGAHTRLGAARRTPLWEPLGPGELALTLLAEKRNGSSCERAPPSPRT